MEEFPYIIMSEDELIWKEEHYGYHITEKKNILSIIEKGLIPMCGERSKRVGDRDKAICFTGSLIHVNKWIEMLYPNEKLKNLILLKINLINKKIKIRSRCVEDYRMFEAVSVEEIEYLQITKDYLNSILNALLREKEYRLEWHNLVKYKS